MEWFLPYYWAIAANPTACPSFAEPAADGGAADLDLDVVRILYGVLVERTACGTCAAPLGPAIDVVRTRGFWARARIRVGTCCSGPRRHRHRAEVVERAGDLWMRQLRPDGGQQLT